MSEIAFEVSGKTISNTPPQITIVTTFGTTTSFPKFSFTDSGTNSQIKPDTTTSNVMIGNKTSTSSSFPTSGITDSSTNSQIKLVTTSSVLFGKQISTIASTGLSTFGITDSSTNSQIKPATSTSNVRFGNKTSTSSSFPTLGIIDSSTNSQIKPATSTSSVLFGKNYSTILSTRFPTFNTNVTSSNSRLQSTVAATKPITSQFPDTIDSSLFSKSRGFTSPNGKENKLTQTIVSMRKMKDIKPASFSNLDDLCSDHLRTIEFYCNPCSTPCCCTCLPSHKCHDWVTIHEHGTQNKQLLKDIKMSYENEITKIKTLLVSTQEMKYVKSSESIMQVNQQFQSIIDELMKLQTLFTAKIQEKDKAIEGLTSMKNKLKLVIHRISVLINHGSAMETGGNISKFENKLTETRQEAEKFRKCLDSKSIKFFKGEIDSEELSKLFGRLDIAAVEEDANKEPYQTGALTRQAGVSSPINDHTTPYHAVDINCGSVVLENTDTTTPDHADDINCGSVVLEDTDTTTPDHADDINCGSVVLEDTDTTTPDHADDINCGSVVLEETDN